MHERTHDASLDEALARILSEPSHASRLLLAAADALDEDPTFTLTPYQLTFALNAGLEQVLAGLPAIVRDQSTEAAMSVMPKTYEGQTAAEYAISLRQAARCV